MLAGRCRCGAGKFLSCGCAGAREDELPVPRAGNGQCQTPPAKQHLVALGHDRRDALGPGTLLVLCLGAMSVGLS